MGGYSNRFLELATKFIIVVDVAQFAILFVSYCFFFLVTKQNFD
jgi:hypothetical protein